MTTVLIAVIACAALFGLVGLVPLAVSRCGDCVDGEGCSSCTLDEMAADLDEWAGSSEERWETRR